MWHFSISLPETPFDAILFDCDGTLIDSMPLHWRAWRAALARQNAPFAFSWEDLHALAGRSIPDTVAILNRQHGTRIDSSRVDADRMDYFFAHLDELTLVDPVADIAQRYRGSVQLGLGSGSSRLVVMRELEHFSLVDWFGSIVTADDVALAKPNPDVWLKGAAELGVAPERCVVLEDGSSGMEAAQAAGMTAIYVPTNEHRQG